MTLAPKKTGWYFEAGLVKRDRFGFCLIVILDLNLFKNKLIYFSKLNIPPYLRVKRGYIPQKMPII